MKINKNFLQGRLNIDVDERITPEGSYPYAENIRVITTDSASLGAVENMQGNKQLTNLNLTNAETIGAFADTSNNLIYWFVTSDQKDLILEYNTKTNVTSTVLESTAVTGTLKFSRNFLITGVIKLINDDFNKNLLAWTDDKNPPRIVNVERAKTYGANNFEEDDISLIKKPPRFAPEIRLTFTTTSQENYMEDKFLSFAYRYKYLDGEYSALSTFTNYQFAPKEFDLDYQTMENNGMVNNFNAAKIIFNTGDKRVKEVELVFKESNSNTVYLIERFNKAEQGYLDDVEKSFIFSNSKKYIALPQDELFRPFDNVPLKAKALEIIGNRLLLGNYVEGYDLKNVYGEDIGFDYNLSLITKSLDGTTIPFTISSDGFQITLNLTGISLLKDTRIKFNFNLTESTTSGLFDSDLDFIFNQNYATASELASDPDFIFFVQDVLTNAFSQQYTAIPPANSSNPEVSDFTIVSSTATSITFGSPTITYQIDNTPSDPNDNDFSEVSYRYKFQGVSMFTYKLSATDASLKTNRSYEVGIIYRDKQCRASSVQTGLNNTIYVPQEFSVSQNKIKVDINHLPPAYADTYKLVVKQNKGQYETIYTNIFYQEGIYRWVLLEGNNKDKVQEGDTLIVKSDISGPLQNIVRVRVLEIATKQRDFIEGNIDVDGQLIKEEPGLYMKIKPDGFNMTFDASVNKVFQGYSTSIYPQRCFTQGAFGTYLNGNFIPYKIKAGSRVRIYIDLRRRFAGTTSYVYDKRFRVQADYNSIKEWFDAEVQNLGQYGIDHTWDGNSYIGPNTVNEAGYGQGNAFNRGSGWDFTSNGDQFWVRFNEYSLQNVFVIPVKFEIFFSEGDVIFETEAVETDSEIYYETEQTFQVVAGKHQGNLQNQTSVQPASIEMDFFNCYVQGNGAESYQYKDKYNAKYLNIDLRPSSTSVERYKQVRRYADLTYSEPYNENNNINGINEFNAARVNYKEDIDKNFGSIQKLYSRDSDVLVFQEDKVSKVLFGKDLLLNADGTSNLASIDNVLGQQIPYTGEYGISTNPESFALNSSYIYFTDAKRGCVMRLAGDGLTEISAYGAKQFFKNNLKSIDGYSKKGAFDPLYDEYYVHDSSKIIVPPEVIGCNQPIIYPRFSGEFDLGIDYGLSTGEIGFGFLTNEVPVMFTVDLGNETITTGFYGDPSYNDQLVEMGYEPVVGSGENNLTFEKTKSSPRYYNETTNLSIAKVKVFTPFTDASIQITPSCPVETVRNVVTIVIASNGIEEFYSYDTRTNWVGGQQNQHAGYFPTDGQVFDTVNGIAGLNKIPAVGATVKTEMWFKPDEDNVGNIKYLLSNTQYTSADIPLIQSLATLVPTTDYTIPVEQRIRGGNFNVGAFSEQYLYIIYDYTV